VKYDYRCHTAGARPCSFRTETNDENALRRQIERHLAHVHHVDPPETRQRWLRRRTQPFRTILRQGLRARTSSYLDQAAFCEEPGDQDAHPLVHH
jgi:hypothetical protein